jgi:tetratricopeptide (TPR) repeat protein
MADRSESLIARGREHYTAGEYDRAEPLLAEAIAARPAFPDVFNMLGVIYHAQGRFSEAEDAFEQALRINPRYTEAALNLSVTYNDRGKYDRAREVYTRAVSASVGQPDAPTEGEPAAPPMPSADQIYLVQVIWDETMADTAAKWLTAHPAAHLVILAGNGHCHDTAIVGRMKRRGIADVISLRPVIDSGEGEVAELLAKPMNDYVIVLQMPEGVKRAPAK